MIAFQGAKGIGLQQNFLGYEGSKIAGCNSETLLAHGELKNFAGMQNSGRKDGPLCGIRMLCHVAGSKFRHE